MQLRRDENPSHHDHLAAAEPAVDIHGRAVNRKPTGTARRRLAPGHHGTAAPRQRRPDLRARRRRPQRHNRNSEPRSQSPQPGDQLQGATESGDTAVQHVLGGHVAPLDLGDRATDTPIRAATCPWGRRATDRDPARLTRWKRALVRSTAWNRPCRVNVMKPGAGQILAGEVGHPASLPETPASDAVGSRARQRIQHRGTGRGWLSSVRQTISGEGEHDTPSSS